MCTGVFKHQRQSTGNDHPDVSTCSMFMVGAASQQVSLKDERLLGHPTVIAKPSLGSNCVLQYFDPASVQCCDRSHVSSNTIAHSISRTVVLAAHSNHYSTRSHTKSLSQWTQPPTVFSPWQQKHCKNLAMSDGTSSTHPTCRHSSQTLTHDSKPYK